MSKTLPEWQKEISEWAESTFDHTSGSIAKHLLREAVELCLAVGLSKADIEANVDIAFQSSWAKEKTVAEESADVLILTLTLAGYVDFSLEDSLIAKHVVNKHRQWGPKDREGVSEHVRR